MKWLMLGLTVVILVGLHHRRVHHNSALDWSDRDA